jgi:hypothetical protein
LWQDRKCKLPYPQSYVLFDIFAGTKSNVVANIIDSWWMTACTLSGSCRLVEEPDVSVFITAVYRENWKSAFCRKTASYLPSYTASYPKHRSSDQDRHLNAEVIIIVCLSATYKCINRPVSAKVLEKLTVSVFRVDPENGGRKFFQNIQNVRCCNQKIPHFNNLSDCYNISLVLKNVSMATNVLVFVTCPSERGATMLGEMKCNIAAAVFSNCIKSMVQIVSMSRYTYTIRHSTSRNLTQNWATAPYFNALEKSQFIVQNTPTVYPYEESCKNFENAAAFCNVLSCSNSLLFIPTKHTQCYIHIFITSYLLHVSLFVTQSSGRPLRYLFKKRYAFCNAATQCTIYPVFLNPQRCNNV